MRYTIKAKRDRNERLRKFAREHPDWTQQAIANVFHIDRSRVSILLRKQGGR